MNVWHSSSSESKPCVLCRKKTAHYKVYEQANISVRVPLCEDDTDDCCYQKVDVRKILTKRLIELKQAIVRSGGTGG